MDGMVEEVVERCRRGELSPEIALARLLLTGTAPDPARLADLAATDPEGGPARRLADLAARHRDRLAALARLAAEGLDPEGSDMLAATRALFDRLAARSPGAAVAFYTLGDPDLLAAATAELVQAIAAWAPVAGRQVLDFGCGAGRVALALAEAAAEVVGLDLSATLLAEARRAAAAAGRRNVRFELADGRTLRPLGEGSVDLVVAADSFPYVVRAGPDVLAGVLAEAARVLRPGGELLVFNWSYRGDPALDRAEADGIGARVGLRLEIAGESPFRLWDAAGFRLRRRP